MYSFPPLLITVADRLNSEICVVKAPPTVQPDIPTSRSISDDTLSSYNRSTIKRKIRKVPIICKNPFTNVFSQ